MIERLKIEEREKEILSPSGFKSVNSRGRKDREEPCILRTCFQRDRDRIIHSKAFRRLMHKTQVFLAPDGDHYRTRLTHTIEVAQVSRTIARALGLNEDLTEAVALGHDLGHTPFGHNGEVILNRIHSGGFKHNVQSLRVVDVLEFRGSKRGMNLTEEVRDGIVNHTGNGVPYTLEGQVVKISDRIAYINHDIDDAIRSGIIKGESLPLGARKVLGESRRMRIDTLIKDIISESDGKNVIRQGEEAQEALDDLRNFMFEKVYHNSNVKKASDLNKVEKIINTFYVYYSNHPEELPKESASLISQFGVEESVKDYIAGMTDRYAVNLFRKKFS